MEDSCVARIVITGANRGIGLAVATRYRQRGDVVIAAVRRSSPALKALGAEVHEGVELGDDGAVARFADAIGPAPIDVLTNNAAIHASDSLSNLNFNELREQLEINAIAPLRVTRALLPKLKAGSKVVIITSRSGSIGDNGSGGNYGYRMSKAAVNMAGVNLAIELKPKGIAVALLHPGMVRTGMGGGVGAIAPELSAERLVARIDELSLEMTGKFLHAEGYPLPW
jgi:NAD(P)-dependent dehydrogenase (short-subunit alcohol dehydrogenase family)